MNCEEESIKIRAKGRNLETIVSLRQNELIQNLRALVAVRFEQAISQIVLVFAGEVLRDEGTIASRGIISGVTVHVVCRPGLSGPTTPAASSSPEPKPQPDLLRSRTSALLAQYLGDPTVMRGLFMADPRIRGLIEENAMLRHYLNSDRNLREMVSQAFGPARQEVERRRDHYYLRLELIPGGYKMLARLSYFAGQAYDNKVAKGFQRVKSDSGDGSNPQRGLENNQPLPNPWLRKPKILDAETRVKYSRLMKAIETGDLQHLRKSAGQGHRLSMDRESSDEETDMQPTCSRNEERRSRLSQPPAKNRNVSFYHRDDYQAQLEELVQMGYTDRSRNLCALRISLGNVDNAVRLLEHWNRSGA